MKWLICVTIATAILFSCSDKKIRDKISLLEMENVKLKSDLFDIQYFSNLKDQMDKYCIQQMGTKIKNTHVYWGIDSLNQVQLSEVVSEDKLILYLSDKMCSPCVDNFIRIVQNAFLDEYESNRIIIVGDIPMRIKRAFHGKIVLSGIELPMDSLMWPAAFVVEPPELEIKYLHLFNKNNPTRTKCYMEKMKEVIFDSK